MNTVLFSAIKDIWDGDSFLTQAGKLYSQGDSNRRQYVPYTHVDEVDSEEFGSFGASGDIYTIEFNSVTIKQNDCEELSENIISIYDDITLSFPNTFKDSAGFQRQSVDGPTWLEEDGSSGVFICTMTYLVTLNRL